MVVLDLVHKYIMMLAVPKMNYDCIAIVHYLAHSFEFGDPVGLSKCFNSTCERDFACSED